LGAFSRPGIAGNDEYLVAPQRLDDRLALRRNRQLGVVLELKPGDAACTGTGCPPCFIRHA
jgi:hypothetical protein